MAVTIPKGTKALIWDLDGTIIDSFGIVEQIIGTIAPIFHRPVPDREIMLQHYHGSLRDSIHGMLGGQIDDDELDRILDVFLEHQHGYYESLDGHFLDDALALSNRAYAAGLDQVLVTNRAHANRGNASPHYIIEHSDLKDRITTIISNDGSNYHKPDPRVLAGYLKLKKFNNHEVIVIGDQFVDAELALNLGTRGVLVARSTKEVAHLNQLAEGWEKSIDIVRSLDEVLLP